MSKTIFITGSTDGIGKIGAEKLAKAGHTVYLHGRNKPKLDQTIDEIRKSSKNNRIEGILSDLSSFKAIRAMILQIESEISELDVLINNAGVYHSTRTQNEAGLDMRFMVNYLAPVYLSTALIPLLKKSQDPRIINLSSAAQDAVDMDALQGKKSLQVNESYAQSKLALTSWTLEVAKGQPAISIVAVNPGSLLNTRMVQEAFGHHWSPAEKGADILFDLSTTPQIAKYHGKYFDNDQGIIAEAHPEAYDRKKIDALQSVTRSLLDQA